MLVGEVFSCCIQAGIPGPSTSSLCDLGQVSQLELCASFPLCDLGEMELLHLLCTFRFSLERCYMKKVMVVICTWFIIPVFPLGETTLVAELEQDSRKISILGRLLFPTLSNSF